MCCLGFLKGVVFSESTPLEQSNHLKLFLTLAWLGVWLNIMLKFCQPCVSLKACAPISPKDEINTISSASLAVWHLSDNHRCMKGLATESYLPGNLLSSYNLSPASGGRPPDPRPCQARHPLCETSSLWGVFGTAGIVRKSFEVRSRFTSSYNAHWSNPIITADAKELAVILKICIVWSV